MADELATTGSTDVAIPGDGVDGLEDFDSTKDASMPMIRLNHDEGQFTDSLTGEDIGSEIEVILLGLVKQRVLWPPDQAEGGQKQQPLCRSYDFMTGIPNPEEFPVKAAAIPGITRDTLEEGGCTIDCASCPLKEWGSHPKQDTPWCTAQYSFPLLTRVGDPELDLWAPAVLTVQRTAIKPANAYLTAFKREGSPLYTVHTKIILEQRHRGTVDYAVPKFVKGGPTDSEQWADYSATFRGVRGFLHTPRTRGTDDETVTAVEEPAAAPTAPAPETPAPVADPAATEETPAAPIEEEAATPPAAAEPAPSPAPAPEAAPAAAAAEDPDGLPF